MNMKNKDKKSLFCIISEWDIQTKLLCLVWVVDAVLIGFALYLFFPVFRETLILVLGLVTVICVTFGDTIKAKLEQGCSGLGNAPSCRSCMGCACAYPVVRKTIYEAIRRCAEHLHIKHPASEQELEACCPSDATFSDHRPRCWFRIMKLKLDFPVSDFAARSMLQKHLTECVKGHPGRFSGTGIRDLYIEDIAQDNDSFLITVMPFCTGVTDVYINSCIQQEQPEETRAVQEEVYDEQF